MHQDEDIAIYKCNLGLYITRYDRGLSHIISIVLPILLQRLEIYLKESEK